MLTQVGKAYFVRSLTTRLRLRMPGFQPVILVVFKLPTFSLSGRIMDSRPPLPLRQLIEGVLLKRRNSIVVPLCEDQELVNILCACLWKARDVHGFS